MSETKPTRPELIEAYQIVLTDVHDIQEEADHVRRRTKEFADDAELRLRELRAQADAT